MHNRFITQPRWYWRLTPVLCLCLVAIGCGRSYWRRNADRQVYSAITVRMNDPRWEVPRIDITPSEQSRFFDPYDPDFGPLPPDDPAANESMWRMGGLKASRLWKKLGMAPGIENPAWLLPYGIDPSQIEPTDGQILYELEGIPRLTLTDAVDLTLIHNRDYQTRLEEVYLAALDVTFERFQFGVRYLGFGAREPSVDTTATFVPEKQNSINTLPRFGISQLLPTGGQWVLELANNTLWLFSSPDTTSTTSIIGYQLTQPLLLNGGRTVVLNNLTLAEREFLYEVRILARFRQEFFADTVAADGASYFALLVQLQNVFNQREFNRRLENQIAALKAISFSHPPEAKVPLTIVPADLRISNSVRSQLTIDPQEKSIAWVGPMTEDQELQLRGLSTNLGFQTAVTELIQAIKLQSTTLDILQLQSSLADAVNRLRSLDNGYLNSLDSYKLKLGLPTDFPVGIDPRWLKAFELTDSRFMYIDSQIADLAKIRTQVEAQPHATAPLRYLHTGLQQQLRTLIEDGLPSVTADVEKVEDVLRQRETEAPSPEEAAIIEFDANRDRRLYLEARDELNQLQETVRQSDEELKLLEIYSVLNQLAISDPLGFMYVAEFQALRRQSVRSLDAIRERLQRLTQKLAVIQIGLRLELVGSQQVAVTMEQAVQSSLENRLDLMNAKARVVDTRRLMELAANQLEAKLDVVINGDIRTPTSTKPFDFRRDQQTLRAGLAFTTPLDQMRERNNYRASLINYQRQRREYMRFEDTVKQQVRTSWRQSDLAVKNLLTWRRAVRIAVSELDAASNASRLTLGQGATTDAGLRGQTLLLALNNVLAAQNNLIQTWLNTEIARIRLHRDMGLMEIDERGLWRDPFYQQLEFSPDSLPYEGMMGAPTEEIPGGQQRMDLPAPTPPGPLSLNQPAMPSVPDVQYVE